MVIDVTFDGKVIELEVMVLRGDVAIALGSITDVSVANTLEELGEGNQFFIFTTSGVLVDVSSRAMVAKLAITIDVLGLYHRERSSIEQGYLIHELRYGITLLSCWDLLLATSANGCWC